MGRCKSLGSLKLFLSYAPQLSQGQYPVFHILSSPGAHRREWLQSDGCSVQLLSGFWLFAAPWTTACQTSLFITNSWSLLKLLSIKSVMPSNHLILCRPLLLLPSIFPSIRVFFNESVLHIRWPKYWSFSFSISPPNEYSGLISFTIYWLDLLAVQGTLKSLLQHHSSKALILWHSGFFMVQFSHPYMTTGKTSSFWLLDGRYSSPSCMPLELAGFC